MIYLATPYSHPDPLIRRTRFLIARQHVAEEALKGNQLFSPIVYWHIIANEFDLPSDAKYWEKFNMTMLRRADFLSVLKIDGWRESKGVTQEILAAEQLHIPIVYVEWKS